MEITKLFKLIYKDTYLLIGSCFIIAGCFVSGYYFNKEKLNTKSDLFEIQSTIQDYALNKYTDSKNHETYSYSIYLKGYNNVFKIIPDFIDNFQQKHFEKAIRPGDEISIYISNQDSTRINFQNEITVFGIKDNRTTYLDYNRTLDDYNSRLSLYIGIGLLLIGLDIFYNNRDKFRAKNVF
jgi:hypothetical protein